MVSWLCPSRAKRGELVFTSFPGLELWSVNESPADTIAHEFPSLDVTFPNYYEDSLRIPYNFRLVSLAYLPMDKIKSNTNLSIQAKLNLVTSFPLVFKSGPRHGSVTKLTKSTIDDTLKSILGPWLDSEVQLNVIQKFIYKNFDMDKQSYVYLHPRRPVDIVLDLSNTRDMIRKIHRALSSSLVAGSSFNSIVEVPSSMALCSMCTRKGVTSNVENPICWNCLALTSHIMGSNYRHHHHRTQQQSLQVDEFEKPIDPDNMDTKISPFVDFDNYANGKWKVRHKIADDRSSVSTFSLLSEKVDDKVKEIVLSIGQGKYEGKYKTEANKIAQYWKSGNNEDAVDRQSLETIRFVLEPIAKIDSVTSLAREIAVIHKRGFGVFFNLDSASNPHKSTDIIAYIDEGGLHLSTPYYNNPENAHILELYEKHLVNMWTIAGLNKKISEEKVKRVIAVERYIAQSCLPPSERRNILKRINLIELKTLLTGPYHEFWTTYFGTLNLDPNLSTINVTDPNHLVEMERLLSGDIKEITMQHIRDYMETYILTSCCSYLNSRLRTEHFEFFGKTITGQEKEPPTWRRVLGSIDRYQLGESLGAIFCEKYFPVEAKTQAFYIINAVKNALRDRLRSVTWMEDVTKEHAIRKIDKLNIQVGRPNTIHDLSTLEVDEKAPYCINFLKVLEFTQTIDFQTIGKPRDLNRWAMNAHEINAYYSGENNQVVIPAGILQPPMFDHKFDCAVNFGGIGGVVGHELTHGFDDQGRRYDEDGNVNDWWTANDDKNFQSRAKLIQHQFNNYTLFGHKVNGSLTQGENLADLGGIKASYLALQSHLSIDGDISDRIIDGFTQNQRFFLAWARAWANKTRKEQAIMQLQTDPHSPAHWRINGPLSNLTEFYKAFHIPEHSPMWREPQLRPDIW